MTKNVSPLDITAPAAQSTTPTLKRVSAAEYRRRDLIQLGDPSKVFHAPAGVFTHCWACDAAAAYVTPAITPNHWIGWCIQCAGAKSAGSSND